MDPNKIGREFVSYAPHSIDCSLVGELCVWCARPATHKVGDQSGPHDLHELTNYLCCECMRMIGMDCRRYPTY